MNIQKKKANDIELGDIIIIDLFSLKCSKLDIYFDIEGSDDFATQEDFETHVCGIKEAPIFLFEVTGSDILEFEEGNYLQFTCDWDSMTRLPHLMIHQNLENFEFDVIVNPFETIPCYIKTLDGSNPNMTAEDYHNS